MKLDKKMVTAFLLVTAVVAGTALASIRMTGMEVSVGTSHAATSTVTTTDNGSSARIAVTVDSRDADLANLIFRILGIPVSVQEITTYRARNMGNGEIALAYNLAAASGKSVDEILDMRYTRKMGWGKIAKVLGVNLHGAVDNSVSILRQSKYDGDADNLRISLKVDLEDNDNHDKPLKSADHDNNNTKDHGKSKSKDK
jgi:hypothetical protein